MSFRRLTTLAVLLVTGAGVALWLAQNFFNTWEPQLRTRLESALSERLHARVLLGSVSLSFFHRIHVHDVEVWSPTTPSQLICRADDVSLTLSFIDLPSAIHRRTPLTSVGLITVHNPYLELSPVMIAGLRRRSGNTQGLALPPLFTLTWEGGTVHWQIPVENGSSMIFHDVKGFFRIRGPHLDMTLRASTPQVPNLRLEFSRLRQRWSVRALLSDGDIPSLLGLFEAITHHVVLPAGWSTRGRCSLEATAGAHGWPTSTDKWWGFLEKSRLSLSDAYLSTGSGRPEFRITGALNGRANRWTTDHLVLNVNHSRIFVEASLWPFQVVRQYEAQAVGKRLELRDFAAALGHPLGTDGLGSAEAKLYGTFDAPILDLRASLPKGRIGGHEVQNLTWDSQYEKKHLNVHKAAVQIAGGVVDVKGILDPTVSDLKISGSNLSVEQAFPAVSGHLGGLLKFSGNCTGPWRNLEAGGTLAIAELAPGTLPPIDVHGDFAWRDGTYKAEVVSSDAHFDLGASGQREGADGRSARVSARLPDGSSFTGHAAWSPVRLRGEFTMTHLRLPGLLRPLVRWTPGLTGNITGHGELRGTSLRPALVATVESDNLDAGGEALGAVKATLEWSNEQLSVPEFTVGSSVHGRIEKSVAQSWVGHLVADHASAEALLRLVAPNAKVPGTISAKVKLHPDGLEVSEGSFAGPQGQTAMVGQAHWSRSKTNRSWETLRFDVNGNASSPQEGTFWAFPFKVEGRWTFAQNSTGVAVLHAPQVTVRGKPADPIEATVEWDHDHLQWRRTHWGRHWSSEGSLHFQTGSPGLAAHLDVADASLPVAARWLAWPHPEELDGAVRGSFTATGTLAEPGITFQTHVADARWRAFHFESDVNGEWKMGSDSTIHVAGALVNGGPFAFEGRLRADSTVSGEVKLDGLNLEPLGQSLQFPQPLNGNVKGSLAVKGTIEKLQFVGHVEGGPVRYGLPDQHPLRLEKFAVDLAIAPAPENSEFTRLTLSKGVFKTAEEEVRWHAGSYVEFANGRPAPLKLGADLRNLHLGVFTIFGGVDLDGRWQIKPAGFAIEGDLSTRSLFINDYELERGHVNVDYYDALLAFTPPPQSPALVTGTVDFHHAPQLHFTNFLLSGRGGQGLQLTGDVGPSLWDFRMTGRGLDIGTLAGLTGFPYPLSGAGNLSVRGTGDFAHPHLEGLLSLTQGSALGLTYTSGEAALVWQNQRLTFTRLALAYPGRYRLEGSGSVPLNSQKGAAPTDSKINFSVRLLDANLGLLQSLSNEIKKARGDVQGLLQITGTSLHPLLHGSLRIKNGDVIGAHYFRRLQNLLLSIDFDGDRVLLRELQGDSEGGTLLAAGNVTLNGFTPSAYDLRADITSAKGLGIQVPELAIPESPLAKRFHFLTTISQTSVKGHMSFQGPAEAPIFKGQATIFNGHFTFPPSRKNPPPPEIVDWFRRINWDATLNFQDDAWFENEYVQANLVGKLALKGPGDALRVDGSLDITQGEISYLGLAFDIRQARFDAISNKADSAVKNTLYVSGVAESQVQATDTLNGGNAEAGNRLSFNDKITLTIDRAPVDEVKPRLTSANNPNLSQEKVLARATQIDMDNLTPQERTYVYQQAMIQILDTSLATPLAKSFLKRTGLVDNFRVQRVIDPSGVSPVVASANTPNSLAPVSQNPFANTKYTVEKDLFNRVTVGYGVRFVPVLTPDLQDKLNLVSDVQLSYRWFKNVYVKGDVDLPSSNSGIIPERRVTIEPTFRFGWWGNTNRPKSKAPTLAAPARAADPGARSSH